MAEPVVETAGAHAVLYRPDGLGPLDGTWFDAGAWKERGAREHGAAGRGRVLILERGGEAWVLRHYLRGGFVSRFVYDHYLWLGLARTRSFREWRLLDVLYREGLPVPRPIAAHARRRGLAYQADIVTGYLTGTRSLSLHLIDYGAPPDCWPEIGRMLRRFHDRGVDHPDLTAHNILLDEKGRAFLVDFDNAALRGTGAWKQAGIARLQRSLRKVALESGTQFDEDGWTRLLAAYAAGARR
jgi:3-deoxy-D-manno-octulosonic acid kinase